jgi:hypothetical protein
MISHINKNVASLERSDQVFLLNPSGETEKCDSYLKLSKGTKFLVTMPEAESFSSNFTIPQVNELAKKLLQYGIETFVVIPNNYMETQNFLHIIRMTHFSIFCDHRNIISNALNITVTYPEECSLKRPEAPEELNVLLKEGSVVYAESTPMDSEFQNLLKKVSELFSETDKQVSVDLRI